MKKNILFTLIFFSLTVTSLAQILKPVSWSFSTEAINDKEAYVVATAKIDKGWHVYSLNIEDGGPIATSLTLSPSKSYTLVGKTTEAPEAEKAFDPNFNMNIAWHENRAVFKQKVKLNTQEAIINGVLEFMVCNDKQCLPPEEIEFKVTASLASKAVAVTPATPVVDKATESLDTAKNKSIDSAVTDTTSKQVFVNAIDTEPLAQEEQSLWAIFLAGFIGGFLALIMPCIFPMLPLTVSFFTKKAGSKAKAVSQAGLYGLFIIVIYVALGLLVTVIFGSDALNEMASNGIFNFVFFLMLVIFAISFFGAFELTLPSAWVNKVDEKSDKGGLAGLFFMAFALALVSFSCTGPIIGTLLVQAASMGKLMGPAIGMFGFSLALAIPFTLFAAFPSLLKSLPKSGGWLNSVKVVLGFIELALAFKFLSNVDLAYHWDILDREVFLVLWIVIFALLGLYLLGKIKFSHDSDLPFVSVPRLFLSIIVFSFTLYMVPGLWGAPLKAISAWLPPQTTQDFDLYTNSLSSPSEKSNVAKKYAGLFEAPHNLDAFFDYEEGMAYAKSVNKPVLIDFTGHSCVNCRKMEASVWSNPEVLNILKKEYVLISLYVDDKTALPETEQYTSTFSGKKVKTLGNKWSDFQASKFKVNSQPYYVIVNDKEELLTKPEAFNLDISNYIRFLNEGKSNYQNKN
ncbi:protein-disulfide reductase DsbD family protein [Pedobacter glucosidilyticus]|uniref:protein-disulfide reductase DsbD family protein n=1 Tax=Pedobacter glucosidilyticus TaxID=1122941 RepID=UPI0026EEB289|nr:thioredoxin family protein [Pedobacter glucosidilyticus]